MRLPFNDIIERGRIPDGYYSSESGDSFGAFILQYGETAALRIIANSADHDSGWWEHVSVSLPNRTPTWEEMCWVKDLFWKEDECVVQFHPPRKDYVNCHPFTLHMWRPTRKKMPMPDPITVGPRGV
jgi:hypothetical protein